MAALNKLDIYYEPGDDALSILWVPGPADSGREVAPGIVLSLDKDGKPVGIEFDGGARELVHAIAMQALAKEQPERKAS
jgi:uncharacterized protein YuzE